LLCQLINLKVIYKGKPILKVIYKGKPIFASSCARLVVISIKQAIILLMKRNVVREVTVGCKDTQKFLSPHCCPSKYVFTGKIFQTITRHAIEA